MSKASDLIAKIDDALSASDDDIRVEGCFQGDALMKLDEGKLVSGRFENNIRIDQPTHLLGGDPHAHVLGRKGNELVIVNLNGSGSPARRDACIPRTRQRSSSTASRSGTTASLNGGPATSRP